MRYILLLLLLALAACGDTSTEPKPEVINACLQEIALQCPAGQVDACLVDSTATEHVCVAGEIGTLEGADSNASSAPHPILPLDSNLVGDSSTGNDSVAGTDSAAGDSNSIPGFPGPEGSTWPDSFYVSDTVSSTEASPSACFNHTFCADNQHCEWATDAVVGTCVDGAPEQGPCTMIYAPVCAVGQIEYGNACDAGYQGAKVLHEGPCE